MQSLSDRATSCELVSPCYDRCSVPITQSKSTARLSFHQLAYNIVLGAGTCMRNKNYNTVCRNAGPVGAAIDSQRYGTVIDGPEDVTASLGYWPPSCDDAALFSRQINTQLELFSIQ
jgi:hypothetical protein